MSFIRTLFIPLTSVVLISGCSDEKPQPLEEVAVISYDGSEEMENIGEFKAKVSSLSERYKSLLGEINALDPLAVEAGDWSLTLDEIDRRGGPAHQRALVRVHDRRMKEIESALLERAYAVEAESRGMTPEEVLKEIMTAAMEPIKKENFKKGGETDIVAWEKASQDAAMLAHLSFVTSKLESMDVNLHYRPSKILQGLDLASEASSDIVFGNKASNVDVEIYMDFECPYCAKVEPAIERLFVKYKDKAKFNYRLYPLPNHPNGRIFANVAYCAHQQGRFWEFHKSVFSDVSKVSGGIFYAKQIAMASGVEPVELEECIASGESNDAIEANLSLGLSKGVTGTPSVLINGIPLSGNQDYSEYERVMEAMLGN